jgi:hypothetical protein
VCVHVYCIYINEFSTSRIRERPYVSVDDGAVQGGEEQWILHRIIGNPTKSVSLIKFMLSRSRVQFTISRHTFRARHPPTAPASPRTYTRAVLPWSGWRKISFVVKAFAGRKTHSYCSLALMKIAFPPRQSIQKRAKDIASERVCACVCVNG